VARILPGEDEALVRNLLALMLELEEHVVTAVADGGSALAALRAGDCDMAVIDVHLGGMSGMEVLAAARRLGARLRAKPIRRVELLAEVNAILGEVSAFPRGQTSSRAPR
jgi:CheY-like chemotaxis protein